METKEGDKKLTRSLAVTAVLLAICMVSQIFKSLSVYITGPVINLCLILAAMSAGLLWGSVLAVITPVTAFIIAASPVMTAVPMIIPFIMLGNEILVLMTHFLLKPAIADGKPLLGVKPIAFSVLASAAKGAFMGLTISLWLLPSMIPAESPLRGKMGVFQATFSLVQFVTALIGFVYFFILWKPLKKVLESGRP